MNRDIDWTVVTLLVFLVAVVLLVVGLLVISYNKGGTYFSTDGDRVVATEIHELHLDVQKLSTQLAKNKQ